MKGNMLTLLHRLWYWLLGMGWPDKDEQLTPYQDEWEYDQKYNHDGYNRINDKT